MEMFRNDEDRSHSEIRVLHPLCKLRRAILRRSLVLRTFIASCVRDDCSPGTRRWEKRKECEDNDRRQELEIAMAWH